MSVEPLLLYDHPVSSNSLKVRFLLAELSLDYERSHVPFAAPRPAGYVELNPFGRIPTLVDGDLVLSESNAILRYLADREGRGDLYPRAPRERAHVDGALDTWATLVRPKLLAAEDLAFMSTGDWETGGGKWEDASDQAALSQAVETAHSVLVKWEQTIADSGTVTGSFSIADCCVGPVLWRWLRLPLDLAELPRTAAVQRAIQLHPSFVAARPIA